MPSVGPFPVIVVLWFGGVLNSHSVFLRGGWSPASDSRLLYNIFPITQFSTENLLCFFAVMRSRKGLMRHLQQEMCFFSYLNSLKCGPDWSLCGLFFPSNWMAPFLFWFPISAGLIQWALLPLHPIPDSGPATLLPFLLWPLRFRQCEEQAETLRMTVTGATCEVAGLPSVPPSVLTIGSMPGGGFAC